jgi:murein DD-endopeptidase MepM/ murein hydrolase activator NlpD
LAGKVPGFKSAWHRAGLGLVALGITITGALIFSASTPIRAVADNPAKVSDVGLLIAGRITAPYGKAYDPYKTGKPVKHNGVDIAASPGTPIYAPADGIVVEATDLYDSKPAYGKVVVFKTADDTQTLLAHLKGYQVARGQRIQKGTPIASVGNTGKSTGPHVHIETFKAGERVDPLSVWPLQP